MKRLISILLALFLTVVASGVASAGTVYQTALNGGNEVPPNASLARGQAWFRLSPDGQSMDFKLIAANIDNVVQAHIHIAAEGVNGPVVQFLFGPVPAGGGTSNGVLNIGTFTSASFLDGLTGQPMSALVEAIESGNAYVNVHTNDGVAPVTNTPGDIPGGEIRGQL